VPPPHCGISGYFLAAKSSEIFIADILGMQIHAYCTVKGKINPITSLDTPEVARSRRLPYFKTMGT